MKNSIQNAKALIKTLAVKAEVAIKDRNVQEATLVAAVTTGMAIAQLVGMSKRKEQRLAGKIITVTSTYCLVRSMVVSTIDLIEAVKQTSDPEYIAAKAAVEEMLSTESRLAKDLADDYLGYTQFSEEDHAKLMDIGKLAPKLS